MPSTLFISRIELHDIESDHKAYSILHVKMADAGFDQVAISDGVEYVMPRATYRHNASSDTSTQTVLDLAKTALNATIAECKKTNLHSTLSGSVYTIKAAETPRFFNLRPVKK
jgi:hypothetical protein